MRKLIEGLLHFQANLHWERRELFEKSVQGQKPQALLITCSDSRVLLDQLMQADPGDLFVHRNAGNLVPGPETPSSEAATIDYAVSTLGVTDIIVCGHYRCGAIKALLDAAAPNHSPVNAWLTHAAETLAAVKRNHSELQGETLWDKAVEQNVLVQMTALAKHAAVAAGVEAGRLRLHAWVLRFETSEVLAYDPCQSAFEPMLDMATVHAALPDFRTGRCLPIVPSESRPSATAPNESQPSWFDALKSDVPASLVVSMVALPLCLAIARACDVPAAVGIITGIIGGIVVGALAGSPLQVSGPTAGQIVILVDVVQRQGIAALGVVVFLAGLIQIVAGALKLGQWFRAVSPAVILGMLAGIGVVLISQQIHLIVDDPPGRSPLVNVLNVPQAIYGVFDGHDGHVGHIPAALIGVLTLGVLVFWKRVARGRLRKVPAVLVAMVTATAVTAAFGLPIQRVDFDGLASNITWLDSEPLARLIADASIWQFACTIAFVASAETLLCASAIDQMHRGPRTRYDRELAAQGVGNVICGVLGALPVTGVIVRSTTNIQAGARTRLSAVLHGVWLLVFVLLLPGVLQLIPTAAFAATLVLTGISLIELPAIRRLWQESRSEGLIAVVTAVVVVSANLLTGVILGIVLSTAKLIYTFSRLRIRRRGDPASGKMTLVLEGSATFLRLPKLAAALEKVAPRIALQIDCKGVSYIDHTCLTLLMNWQKDFEAAGGRLVLDWDLLRSRFQTGRPRPFRSSRAANAELALANDAASSQAPSGAKT